MLKLHGAPISSYYNMVKLALLEKGFDFEEVRTGPNQSPEFLAISPMGKIPCLEVAEGFLSETDVILEFIQEIHPDFPLLPEDPFQRGKVRQIMRICELYVDQPMRPLLGSVLTGQPPSDHAVARARPELEKGMAALGRVTVFDPWIAGSDFTNADIVAYFATGVAAAIASAVYQWDIGDAIEGYRQWRQRVGERHFVREVDSEWRAALQAFRKA